MGLWSQLNRSVRWDMVREHYKPLIPITAANSSTWRRAHAQMRRTQTRLQSIQFVYIGCFRAHVLKNV